MKILAHLGLRVPTLLALLCGASLPTLKASSVRYLVEDPLPKEPLPLHGVAQSELRTVTQLRPGLTHVNIKRGSWQKDGSHKVTFISRDRTKEEAKQLRASLERAGYTVYEKISPEESDNEPRYTLTAGEFSSSSEAIAAAKEIPEEIQLAGLFEMPGKEALRPFVMEIVVLDPKVYKGKIISAWSGGDWRTSPLEEAIKHDAVVATNGSFFNYSQDEISGVPNGISITEGIWHSEHYPPSKKAAILFIENHQDGDISLSISRTPPPLPELEWGSGKRTRLDGIDRMPKRNELVAMRATIFHNSAYSHNFLPELRPDILSSWVREASSGLEYILFATGKKQEALNVPEHPLRLDLSVPERPGLSALYTTPALIENGVPYEPWGDMGLVGRTAIGVDAQGKIYLMIVHSSATEFDSTGTNLHELRDIGIHLGLVNFANMDGGGRSTSMVIEGKVMGDTPRRYDLGGRVADSILIIDAK